MRRVRAASLWRVYGESMAAMRRTVRRVYGGDDGGGLFEEGGEACNLQVEHPKLLEK